MGKRLNIGLDVDGCVSNFTLAARKLMKKMFHCRPSDDLVQTTWAFESLGINQAEENAFWREVDTIPNWWLDHKPMPDTDLLPQLCEKHRVIFITNRKDGTGWPIEDQTKVWLKRNFGLNNTNVIISDDKGPLSRGLKLHYFLDDRPKNVQEMIRETPLGLDGNHITKTFLLNATYNQECLGVDRVSDLNDFIRTVEASL